MRASIVRLRPSPRDSEITQTAPGQRSLGFNLVVEHLQRFDKPDVLDLGPANTDNVEFLARFRSRVFVEDLAEYLGWLGPPPEDGEGDAAQAQRTRALADLLAFGPETRFDAVLAWDLFNYLQPKAQTALVRRLIPFCRRGTLMFALVSVNKGMAESPARFKILESDRLEYALEAGGPRPSPQYSIADLLKRLPEFSIERSYLLQNGMQEYVFRFV